MPPHAREVERPRRRAAARHPNHARGAEQVARRRQNRLAAELDARLQRVRAAPSRRRRRAAATAAASACSASANASGGAEARARAGVRRPPDRAAGQVGDERDAKAAVEPERGPTLSKSRAPPAPPSPRQRRRRRRRVRVARHHELLRDDVDRNVDELAGEHGARRSARRCRNRLRRRRAGGCCRRVAPRAGVPSSTEMCAARAVNGTEDHPGPRPAYSPRTPDVRSSHRSASPREFATTAPSTPARAP